MTNHLTFLCAPGGDPTVDPLLGDAPLSEICLRKARATDAALAPHGLDVRAPSIRCSQTADALGIAAATESELCDLDLGTWRGRTVDEIAATDPDGFSAWLTDPDAAPHDGESVRLLCRRTAAWLNSGASDPGHTVAVTEAAVVRAALIHALGIPARAFWHLAVPPLCAVAFIWRDGYWDVRLDHPAPEEGQRWIHTGDQGLQYAPIVISPRQRGETPGDGRIPGAGAFAA